MKQSIEIKRHRENERLIGGEKAEYAKSCRRQILASFLASLMSFSSGTVIAGWSPTNERRVDDDLELWSNEQESWIISIYVFGAMIGTLPAGVLSQRYGHKSFLLWLAFLMTVGWILCLLKLNELWMECLGRFLCGISLGATTVAVPMYSSDVSSDVLRGRTGVSLDFMLCAGILYAYVARTVLASLRNFCVACAVVPSVFAFLFSYMPESPAHLFRNGRYEEAAAALRWLRGRRFNVKNEFEKMERSQWSNKEQFELGGNINSENRRFLVRVLIVSFGLVLVQRLSGAGGVIQYSNVLFKLSGITVDTNMACITVGAFQLAASGVSFLLVDRVGRRTLLLISSGIVTTCLVLIVIYFRLLETGTLADSPWKISLLFILCVFIFAFRLGLGPIPWFISTELVSAEYGGRIQSIAALLSWFMSFLIMKSFKMLVENVPVTMWCSFAAYSAAGFVFVLFYVPETNNKSREQIRIDLVGQRRLPSSQ